MPDLADIWTPILLTLVLASVVTAILLVIGTAIAWWLVRTRAPWKEAVATVTALPLVLPPTVLGFYLLLALGPNGPGGWLAGLWGGRTLAFSFWGLVLGSIIYSMPFMVQPMRNAFEAVGEDPIEAAATLGANHWQQFFRVALPSARGGLFSGAVLTFAHTVGEFGVVLMIGGNIPGQTKLISIAIYDYVERLQWMEAHVVALGMVVFAFVVILLTTSIERRTAGAGR